jgi:integrase
MKSVNLKRTQSSLRLLKELEPLVTTLERRQDLTPQSRDKFAALIIRFAGYLDGGHGLDSLEDVLPDHVRGFLEAPSSSTGALPSTSTMRLRRSAVRLLFQLARQSGMRLGDPTLDLSLPSRIAASHRPLADAEVEACEHASMHVMEATRLPAAWALAESTARTSELPNVRASDLDLPNARVWLHGGSKTEARWGHLNEWGTVQLQRRLRALARIADRDPSLIYQGHGNAAAAQSAGCVAVTTTMRRAGIPNEPSVRPASVAAWAGRQLLDAGAPVEEVALRLGIRSLDRTSAFIGLRWRSSGNVHG